MMRIKNLFFIVMLLVVVNAVAQAANVTKVIVYKPTVVPTEKQSGNCFANSVVIARPDAWRCDACDPCFLDSASHNVICGADPSKNKPGFVLQLTKPLPKVEPWKEIPAINVWMIELEDGSICTPFQGTRPAFKDQNKLVMIPYACSSVNKLGKDVNVGLVEDSIKTGKVWQAQKIVYNIHSEEPFAVKKIKIQKVSIKKVWQ